MNEYFYEMTKELSNKEFLDFYSKRRKEKRLHGKERYDCDFHRKDSEEVIEEWIYACGY